MLTAAMAATLLAGCWSSSAATDTAAEETTEAAEDVYKRQVKKHLSEYLSAHPAEGIQGFLTGRERELSIKKEHGLLKGGEERMEQWINCLLYTSRCV